MIPRIRNLLAASSGTEEDIHPLLQAAGTRLEHLVSHGHAGPPGFWYDQPEDEWVVLLRGSVTLDFGPEGKLEWAAGDSLAIPAHAKHRVDRVSEDAVWVALHFRNETPREI